MDFSLFKTSYQALNSEQKRAVDTIEGPVMVVAGAGTGKTQTIALRIANILKNSQTPPGAILCLTFTDNAAINMRQRLLALIGPAAYRVGIYTFHSFCNEVINSHPQYFLFAHDLKHLDELEKIEIIQSLIDALPPAAALKPWGDNYYYQKEIISRISELKREAVNPQQFDQLIGTHLDYYQKIGSIFQKLKSLKASKLLSTQLLELVDDLLVVPQIPPSVFRYLSFYLTLFKEDKFTKGPAKSPAVNFKNFLISFIESIAKNGVKQTELQSIYQAYQQELVSRGRYDYDDMILFVLNAFSQYPDLLFEYQERFLYFLVDEYQDTNSSQNRIIELLASYHEQPNLFVVGDDDQSIFRFQGAAIENIYHFYLKYLKPHNLNPIVLVNNYRSHQLILDASSSLISQNKYRIANLIKNVDKSLKSNSVYDSTPIQLLPAPDSGSENYYVAHQVKKLVSQGVEPSQIAVLFRANADVLDLTSALSAQGVRYRLETGDDILSLSHIVQLVTFLEYLVDPTSDYLLYRILNFPFLKINFIDLFKINQYCYHHRLDLSQLVLGKNWPSDLVSQLKPSSLRRLNKLRRLIALSQRWLTIFPPERFFNLIIRKFGYLAFITSQNDINLINALNCFYQELKSQTQDRQLTLAQFLSRIRLMKENRLSLFPTQLDYDYSDSIRLMTVHKAKGLEFEHVFIIRFLDKKWGNNRNYDSLILPLGLIETELALSQIDQDYEDERRLFYVALTRAKKQVYISYPIRSATNRELLPSQFLAEIDPKLIQPVKLPSGFYQAGLVNLYSLDLPKSLQSIDTQRYLKQYLVSSYCFNVTHLNSYLKCPLCFYYQTILRLPSPKDKHSSLGTAIHRTLSYLSNHLKTQGILITRQEFLDKFEQYLKEESLPAREHEESISRGQGHLGQYYDHYQHEFNPNVTVDYDFRSQNVYLDNIPITGKIDKIEIITPGKPSIIGVVDYKTGNPDTKSAELSPGGDYFRQLVFYSILARQASDFPYRIKKGTIDFVFKSQRSDRFIRKDYVFTESDINQVESEIKSTYNRILSLEFPPSPECKNKLGYHDL